MAVRSYFWIHERPVTIRVSRLRAISAHSANSSIDNPYSRTTFARQHRRVLLLGALSKGRG